MPLIENSLVFTCVDPYSTLAEPPVDRRAGGCRGVLPRKLDFRGAPLGVQLFLFLLPLVNFEPPRSALVVHGQAGDHLDPEPESFWRVVDFFRQEPERGGAVPTARQHGLAVGAERHGEHLSVVLQRRAPRLPGRSLPTAAPCRPNCPSVRSGRPG